jgi:hypothetical protein
LAVEASAIPAGQLSTHSGESGAEVVKKTLVILSVLGMVAHVSARGSDSLARFDGGIGVIPVSNGAGPINADGTFPNVKLNIVRGVVPGGGPWTIADLKAEVDTNGHISVRGRGLLLANGNAIGQNNNQHVFATLICEAAAPFVEHNTTFAVPLAPNGDFRIDDVLNPVPSNCPSPVLLIRNTGGVWFAAGIPKFDDEK